MPKNILYVEDSANTAMALKVMLELKGYRVETADSVAAARDLLKNQTFDVVISDIGLPDGHGWDVLKDAASATRSIAISGYTAEKDRKIALDNGFSAYLTKPFATEALIQEIERA